MSNDRRRKPTNAELVARNKELEAENQLLRWNPTFGCLTRRGFALALQGADLTGRVCVYWDLDEMKKKNDLFGKPNMNVRIHHAIHARAEDTLVGQVFSGDEFAAFPLAEEAVGLAERLYAALHEQELSGTFVIVLLHPSGPEATLFAADDLCMTTKAQQRDRIVDYR